VPDIIVEKVKLLELIFSKTMKPWCAG